MMMWEVREMPLTFEGCRPHKHTGQEDSLNFESQDAPGFSSCRCSFIFFSLSKRSSLWGGRRWLALGTMEPAVAAQAGAGQGSTVDGMVRIWWASSTICASHAPAACLCSTSPSVCHPERGFHENYRTQRPGLGSLQSHGNLYSLGFNICLCHMQAQLGSSPWGIQTLAEPGWNWGTNLIPHTFLFCGTQVSVLSVHTHQHANKMSTVWASVYG